MNFVPGPGAFGNTQRPALGLRTAVNLRENRLSYVEARPLSGFRRQDVGDEGRTWNGRSWNNGGHDGKGAIGTAGAMTVVTTDITPIARTTTMGISSPRGLTTRVSETGGSGPGRSAAGILLVTTTRLRQSPSRTSTMLRSLNLSLRCALPTSPIQPEEPAPPPPAEPALTIVYKDGHSQEVHNYAVTRTSLLLLLDEASTGPRRRSRSMRSTSRQRSR